MCQTQGHVFDQKCRCYKDFYPFLLGKELNFYDTPKKVAC